MAVAYSYIRFSTTTQKKGDSLDRQLQLAEEWVQEHGLTLDTSLTLRDLGISAYRSRNLEKGALGVFMASIESGRVKPGSFLLVESLDRISRTKPFIALQLFIAILNAGITIVTLLDKKVYSSESIDKNTGSLTDSINIMARAHDESATKSTLITKSWNKRREKARTEGLKLTKKCPRWLKLSDDRTEFIVIPEAAAVVERIFQMIIEGHSTHAIEYTFNREKVPTFGRKKMWNRNSILKIINNRWVLGEYQSRLLQPNGSLTPVGDPIPNYYPRIITDAIYHAARQVLETKRGVSKGPKGGTKGHLGERFSNLLTGLCKCGYCGSTMVFIDKRQKSGPYVLCSHAKMGGECSKTRWEYADAELNVMHLAKELRVEDISADPNHNCASRLAAVRARVAELEKSQTNLITAIEQAPDVAALAQRLTAVSAELNEQLKFEEELKALIEGSLSPEQRIADLAALREKLKILEGVELYNLRLRINSELKQIMTRVEFYADGNANANGLLDVAVTPNMTLSIQIGKGQEHQFMIFRFRNETARVLMTGHMQRLGVNNYAKLVPVPEQPLSYAKMT